jgi:hypothetical protein
MTLRFFVAGRLLWLSRALEDLGCDAFMFSR